MELEIVGLVTDSDGKPTGQIAVKVIVPNLKRYPTFVVGRVCPMSSSAVAFYLGGEVEKSQRVGRSVSFSPYPEVTHAEAEVKPAEAEVTQ